MKLLLVIGLLVFIAFVVALSIRRGSGGYRRRFAPLPGGPRVRAQTRDASTDATPVWSPMLFTDGGSSSHGAPGADCSSGAHAGADCGAGAGADGGGGGGSN